MKYSYKQPPFDLYDTVAFECWLSDMAKKGLVYAGYHFIGFRFLKTEPQEICYRVEPTLRENTEPTEEMLSAYAEAGWEFVAHQGNLFFVWKSTRPDPTELHTDPIVQSESYRRLCKTLTQGAIVTGIGALAIIAMLLGGFFISNRPVTLFLTSPLYILLVIMEVLVATQTIQSARAALRIRKMLADGFFLSHEKDYRKGYRIYRVINALALSLAAVIVVTSFLPLTSDWRKSTADVTAPLPYLPLDLIEQSEEFAWREPKYRNDGVDDRNYVDYTWTPLVPEHYEIHQEGADQSRKWADGSGYYAPSTNTEYYRLTFSAFAPAMFDELMEKYLWEDDEYTITEPEAFDRTVLAVEEQYSVSHLFVRWGNQVIYIRYQGDADLSQRLDLLADVLSRG